MLFLSSSLLFYVVACCLLLVVVVVVVVVTERDCYELFVCLCVCFWFWFLGRSFHAKKKKQKGGKRPQTLVVLCLPLNTVALMEYESTQIPSCVLLYSVVFMCLVLFLPPDWHNTQLSSLCSFHRFDTHLYTPHTPIHKAKRERPGPSHPASSTQSQRNMALC